MSGTWFSIAKAFFSLLFMAAAVKLMDDSLDAEMDAHKGQETLAVRMGRGVVPYVALLAVLAVSMNRNASLAAFFGSYMTGMFANLKERLPSKVPAWVEVALVAAVAVVVLPWQYALWGVAMMCVVNWLDDVVDYTSDQTTGQWNLARRLGIAETLLLVLIALSVAVLTDAVLTALTFIVVPVVEILASATTVSVSDRGKASLARHKTGA